MSAGEIVFAVLVGVLAAAAWVWVVVEQRWLGEQRRKLRELEQQQRAWLEKLRQKGPRA